MTRPLLLKKRSKFGAIKSEYGGQVYDSKREAAHGYSLDILKAAGEVDHWERQVRIPLEVNGFPVCTYVVDFLVYYTSGKVVYEEVRGMDRPDSKIKIALFKALHPDRILRIIR